MNDQTGSFEQKSECRGGIGCLDGGLENLETGLLKIRLMFE